MLGKPLQSIKHLPYHSIPFYTILIHFNPVIYIYISLYTLSTLYTLYIYTLYIYTLYIYIHTLYTHFIHIIYTLYTLIFPSFEVHQENSSRVPSPPWPTWVSAVCRAPRACSSSCLDAWTIGGFHSHWGVPTNSWMVYFMENRIYKWMRTGGSPIVGNLQIGWVDEC